MPEEKRRPRRERHYPIRKPVTMSEENAAKLQELAADFFEDNESRAVRAAIDQFYEQKYGKKKGPTA